MNLKKTEAANKSVVAKISYNEYEDVFLNKKCLRHSMNRLQSKKYSIGKFIL